MHSVLEDSGMFMMTDERFKPVCFVKGDKMCHAGKDSDCR